MDLEHRAVNSLGDGQCGGDLRRHQRQYPDSDRLTLRQHGDTYHALMWRFYHSHRSPLFRLAHTLWFVSGTRDTSVQRRG